MKIITIILVALLLLVVLNSCSCQAWFNNGSCEWSETFIGGAFK